MVEQTQRRDRYESERRSVVLDQRQVAGELVVPVDELLGAVQRVDQPVAVCLATNGNRVWVLLAHDRDVFGQFGKTIDQDLVCREVGPCNRRLV